MNDVLHTPASHLPDGYPLPRDWEHARFEPIFLRAFEIHDERLLTGQHPQGPFSRGCLCPVETDGVNYCDCYERAYREFHFAPVKCQIVTNELMFPLTTRRKILLEKEKQ